jgi:hypothetical protein
MPLQSASMSDTLTKAERWAKESYLRAQDIAQNNGGMFLNAYGQFPLK